MVRVLNYLKGNIDCVYVRLKASGVVRGSIDQVGVDSTGRLRDRRISLSPDGDKSHRVGQAKKSTAPVRAST